MTTPSPAWNHWEIALHLSAEDSAPPTITDDEARRRLVQLNHQYNRTTMWDDVTMLRPTRRNPMGNIRIVRHRTHRDHYKVEPALVPTDAKKLRAREVESVATIQTTDMVLADLLIQPELKTRSLTHEKLMGLCEYWCAVVDLLTLSSPLEKLDLNTCPETALLDIHGLDTKTVTRIVTQRPYTGFRHLGRACRIRPGGLQWNQITLHCTFPQSNR